MTDTIGYMVRGDDGRYSTVYLTYNHAIYWLDTAYYVEYAADQSVPRHDRFGLAQRIQERLTLIAQAKAQELGWVAYCTVPSEHLLEVGGRVIGTTYRRTLYERPGYQEVSVFQGGDALPSFRIANYAGWHSDPIDLPLRPLIYHGERARGALHDDVLYVVLP